MLHEQLKHFAIVATVGMASMFGEAQKSLSRTGIEIVIVIPLSIASHFQCKIDFKVQHSIESQSFSSGASYCHYQVLYYRNLAVLNHSKNDQEGFKRIFIVTEYVCTGLIIIIVKIRL